MSKLWANSIVRERTPIPDDAVLTTEQARQLYTAEAIVVGASYVLWVGIITLAIFSGIRLHMTATDAVGLVRDAVIAWLAISAARQRLLQIVRVFVVGERQYFRVRRIIPASMMPAGSGSPAAAAAAGIQISGTNIEPWMA
jgi:hypothetical protein